MKIIINKIVVRFVTMSCVLLLFAPALFAQEQMSRFALLIGNAEYARLPKLKNSVNDATDMADTLKNLGWDVTLLVNADLPKMEDEVIRLGSRVASSPNSVGLFYFAGHGVQSNGINYLIPSDADIPGESFLKTKSLAAQSVLDELQKARNNLNIIILDACRDNPFGWSRSGSRGLSVVSSQPPGSIIVFATAAGSVAREGSGRNGVFTTQLLKNLKIPGLEIGEVLNRTCSAVQETTQGEQNPAIYSQYFKSFYFNEIKNAKAQGSPAVFSSLPTADLLVRASERDADIYLDGAYKGKAPLLIQRVDTQKTISLQAKNPTSEGKADIVLQPGELREVDISMSPLKGGLIIFANESDVQVLIDGKNLGALASGVFRDLPLGIHTVELLGKDLYYSQLANIGANIITQVNAVMTPVGSIDIKVPIDAQVKVVHGTDATFFDGPTAVQNLPEGVYYLEAWGKDYKLTSTTLNVEKGVQIVWEPFTYGAIAFDVQPKGSTFFLKEFNNSYPAEGEIQYISPGTYHGILRKEGYNDTEISIDVSGGKKTIVKANLAQPKIARVAIKNYGIDIWLYANGKFCPQFIQPDGYVYYEGFPTGVPVSVEFVVPTINNIQQVNIPSKALQFSEGETKMLELDSGKVKIPWIKENSTVFLGNLAYRIGTGDSNEFLSPALPVGKYSIKVYGDYTYEGYIEVEKDNTAYVTGYIDSAIESLGTKRAEVVKNVQGRKSKATIAGVSLGVGILGVAGSVASYVLGIQAKNEYDAATDTASALAARSRVELYETLLPVTASVGGTGIGLSLILRTGTDISKLQQSIDEIDQQIHQLQMKKWGL